MTIIVNSSDAIDWEADAAGQMKNNILNLLRTRRGEIRFMPTVGLDPDYVGHPVNLVQGGLYNDIAEQIAQWEPTANLESLSVDSDEAGNLEVEVVIT